MHFHYASLQHNSLIIESFYNSLRFCKIISALYVHNFHSRQLKAHQRVEIIMSEMHLNILTVVNWGFSVKSIHSIIF